MASIKRKVKDSEIRQARLLGEIEALAAASAVTFDKSADAVMVTMRSGAVATIPRTLIPLVSQASPHSAANVELSPMGTSLRFPSIDADFAVQGLIRLVFGLNEANRIAGATKSAARAVASRENGHKGGRPRKTTTTREPAS